MTKGNIADIAALGADIVVTGSAIFDGTPDVEANAAFMRSRLGDPATS